MRSEGRIVISDWNLYDTRHVVYRPARLQPEVLKAGYDWAYDEFYRWGSIARASLRHGTLKHQVKHFFYASGWKKFEPLWDVMIRARQLRSVTPMLEAVLSKVTRQDMATNALQWPEHVSQQLVGINSLLEASQPAPKAVAAVNSDLCKSSAAAFHANASALPLGSPPNPNRSTS
jgi:hypothetical protein